VHDFPDPAVPKAVPYGIYDLAADAGWVSVGSDGDTAAFAVETLRRWWTTVGGPRYPKAKRLLITADAGSSNGYRVRLWKRELAQLADETGLAITVNHFPPGTSKWNRIEHRPFAHISMNWRGRPLTSHQVIIELIGATTTRTGLTADADADTNSYPRGVKVSDAEMAAVKVQDQSRRIPRRVELHHPPENYTLVTNSTVLFAGVPLARGGGLDPTSRASATVSSGAVATESGGIPPTRAAPSSRRAAHWWRLR